MPRRMQIMLLFLLVTFLTWPVFAQDEKLTGRWEGKTSSPQGERDTVASFKKEGDALTGTITGMRGDIQLKDIKIDGSKVTAKAEVQGPQATLVINYSFVLEGDSLKGKGALDFNGNPFEFDVALKRTTPTTAAAASKPTTTAPANATAPAPPAGTGQRAARASVPQPQQKQSIDYFVGEWEFKYKGRDSVLGSGMREGVVSFTKNADGKSVTGKVSGNGENGAYKETITITFDEGTKALVTAEKLASGAALNLKGDWTSPIAIRSVADSLKIKGETLTLRRTVNIIAAHSFSVTDEISENDGPFVRLGNGVYSKR